MQPLLLPAGSFAAASAAPCCWEAGASPTQEEGLSAGSFPSATSPGRVLGERWVGDGVYLSYGQGRISAARACKIKDRKDTPVCLT